MQRIYNYGSFLQAYGLKKIVESLGGKVEFVDYHKGKPLIEKDSSKGFKHKVKKGFELLNYRASIKQKIQFINYKRNFANKYVYQLGIGPKMNYNPKLDVLIIGSDEVFNCVQSNPNVGYSLELFGKNNNANQLVSYAASFGNTTIKKLKYFNKTIEIRELLDNFDSISVRDRNSESIVYDLIQQKPDHHLDPVLIYNFKHDSLTRHVETNEDYIILYAYSGRISHKESNWIKQYAKKKNYKIYTIGGVQECADRFIDCEPFEVLSYFSNAKEVITDTFHGTIFSVISHKKFVTLVRKSQGTSYGNEEKLSDLLTRIDLQKQMTYDIENAENILKQDINYEIVDKFLEKERNRSIKYLSNIIDKNGD